MWYLVVPPIVVVLSLFFLLWYLSRKGDDPTIAQRMLENGEEHSRFFLRIREFFLKVIEKMAQRFKVSLLRAHNVLNDFTQSVKKTRTKMRPESSSPALSQSVRSGASFETAEAEKSQPISVKPEKFSSTDVLSRPIERKGRMAERNTVPEKLAEAVPRPMVSETMAHPETRRKTVAENSAREESLIARIARDPKDFTAYEELGDHYLEIGNIKDAKECYRQVLKLSPVHRMVKIKIRRLEKLLTRGGE